jgi:hypothetical protein
MPQCLIPGCTNNGEHNISIRCRRPDTSAIWAPNTEAFLCDDHAAQGYTIDITLVPAAAQTITTNVTAGGHVETRTTPIVNQP